MSPSLWDKDLSNCYCLIRVSVWDDTKILELDPSYYGKLIG